MTDRKQPTENDAQEPMLVSRRRLVYAAPVLMSRRMFYKASGCGKSTEGQGPCKDLQGS
jgi:hypothetical protein